MNIKQGDALKFKFSARYKNGVILTFKSGEKLIAIISNNQNKIILQKVYLIDHDVDFQIIHFTSKEMCKCTPCEHKLEIKHLSDGDYKTILQRSLIIDESVVLNDE